jgi:DNA repair exonuclease SbcCD nuclease subunit
MKKGEDEVALTLVHTADWHIGRRFPQLGESDGKKLAVARLEVVEKILRLADQRRADAVLCAGDLFDTHAPLDHWWQELAAILSRPAFSKRPIFLLPGNHDPLVSGSVWEVSHPFRKKLPSHVHVVDRPDFSFELKDGAVLYAVPCTSHSSHKNLALTIPARAPGDDRIRVGMVHGASFDMTHYATNYPITKDAAIARGLDYLAIGDTHGFRNLVPDGQPPIIYPGAPEPTAFDEIDPGHVALVLFTRQRRAIVQKHPVAEWHWEEMKIASMAELRALGRRSDLVHKVLRLEVKLSLSAEEYDEAEEILRTLAGHEASHPKVGVLVLEKELSLDTTSIPELVARLPEPLQAAARLLQEKEPEQGLVARRALYRLYELAKREVGRRAS